MRTLPRAIIQVLRQFELLFSERVWALPFLSVLAPSERYYQERGQRHKTLTNWARQIITQVRRWLPERLLVVVADSTYAALELLAACQGLPQPVTLVTRLRLDAGLYEPAPPRKKGQRGRTPKKGKRQPTLVARLVDPTTNWYETTVRRYGGVTRTVRLATGTAVWYHPGMPPVWKRPTSIGKLSLPGCTPTATPSVWSTPPASKATPRRPCSATRPTSSIAR